MSYGDLDIHNSMTIRGINGASGQTSVGWRAGVNDAVFDLLGDYNDDHVVDAADYSVWRDTPAGTGSGTAADWEKYAADGDDDGDVDGDDYSIWRSGYGLALESISVA